MNMSSSRAAVVAAVFAAGVIGGGVPSVANAAPAGGGARSVTVVVKNHTTLRFSLDDSDVSEGDWTTEPPSSIKALKKVQFGSESTESKGGTEATVTYETKYGEIEFYWRNPWKKDNEFTCEVPEELECETDEGNLGAHPKVTFDIRPADAWDDEDDDEDEDDFGE